MTEQDWLSSADPAAMIEHLRGKASDRKLRLFACACVRAVWDGAECRQCDGNGLGNSGLGDCHACRGTGRVGGLSDPRSRRAVEVAERYADGEATAEQMSGGPRNWGPCESSAISAAEWAISSYISPPAAQAALLRDIFGNPFRPAGFTMVEPQRGPLPGEAGVTSVGPTWENTWYLKKDAVLRWNDGTVPRIAEGIYRERAWGRMPQLHDALLDAGCDDEGLLRHCRDNSHRGGCFVCQTRQAGDDCPHCVRGIWADDVRGNPVGCDACLGTGKVQQPLHARGCWCLDLLLGKE